MSLKILSVVAIILVFVVVYFIKRGFEKKSLVRIPRVTVGLTNPHKNSIKKIAKENDIEYVEESALENEWWVGNKKGTILSEFCREASIASDKPLKAGYDEVRLIMEQGLTERVLIVPESMKEFIDSMSPKDLYVGMIIHSRNMLTYIHRGAIVSISDPTTTDCFTAILAYRGVNGRYALNPQQQAGLHISLHRQFWILPAVLAQLSNVDFTHDIADHFRINIDGRTKVCETLPEFLSAISSVLGVDTSKTILLAKIDQMIKELEDGLTGQQLQQFSFVQCRDDMYYDVIKSAMLNKYDVLNQIYSRLIFLQEKLLPI